MASRSEDLPDPVGPLMANTSSVVKSISVASRKAVKPFSSSLSGLMPSALVRLLKHLVERPEEIRGDGVQAMLSAEIADELVSGLQRGQRGPLVGHILLLVIEFRAHG